MRVLRSKYRCGDDFIHVVSCKHGSSNLWRGICEAWPYDLDNLVWRIRDGHFINFWARKWIPQADRLSTHCLVLLFEMDNHVSVADLFQILVVGIGTNYFLFF